MTARMLVLVGLTVPVVTAPMSADALDFNLCCVENIGLQTFSFINIPTFDASLGTLQSTTYDVTFYGAIATETSCADCQFSYDGTVFPFFLLFSPVDLFSVGTFPLSGTATTDNAGLGVVSFTGRAAIDPFFPGNGVVGPPSSIPVGAHFYAFASMESGQWFLFYDFADVNIQYNYTPVPEPKMLGEIASILFTIIFVVCRGRAARKLAIGSDSTVE
jgi:hypothetical protein